MHFKSLLKGIGLSILFTVVNAGETCDYLRKYSNIVSTCYSDVNKVPYQLWIRNDLNNTILNDVAKLTSLKELSIDNNYDVDLDLTILKKLKKMTKFEYGGILNDNVLSSISELSSITDLTIESTDNGNVNLKPLKGLKLKILTINCNNVDVDSANYIVPKTLKYFADTLNELYIGDCLIDENENLSSLTKVTFLNAYGWIDNRLFKKITSMKSVKKIRFYFQKLGVGIKDKYEIDISDLKSAPKLTELQLSTGVSRYRDRVRVKVGSLKGLKKLKSLSIHGIALKQENIDEISKMKTIESLNFEGCPLVKDDLTEIKPTYDSLTNLKSSLKYLSYSYPKKTVYDSDKFSEFPEFILSLINLKNLTINDSYMISIPERIVELKKIEYLDLSNNNLKSLPDNINNLRMLKYIDVHGNGYLYGKTLNNNKLEYCNYKDTDMCKDEEVDCLINKENSKLNSCISDCNQYYSYLSNEKGITKFSKNYCDDNGEGKAESVKIDDSEIDEYDIDYLLNYKDTITKIIFSWSGNENTIKKITGFTNVKEMRIYLNIGSETLDLSPLNGLVKLENLAIYNNNEKNSKIKEGSLDKLTNLHDLYLEYITLTQGLVDDIGKLTSLRVLDINYSGFSSEIDYDSWINLKNVYFLYIRNIGNDETPLYEIPKAVYSMTSLSRLTITDLKISTIDSDIANLKNLGDLDLSFNNLTSLPIELNTMENLYSVNFYYNKNLKGQIVDNDNITSCSYDHNTNLCKPREYIRCIDDTVGVGNILPICNN